MSQSARVKKGEVKGRQADRCSLCGHMRRWHSGSFEGTARLPACSVCGDPGKYFHEFTMSEGGQKS